MKNPWEWEEEDVEALISNRVQESLKLDYKRCNALKKDEGSKKEISKDVSAFANSAGGVIIYGVIENNNIPESFDVGYEASEITREWLEQVINSKIERKIDGIRIKQIELKKNNPGKFIYSVFVPQSLRAPHMASDNRFYKRNNFLSVPMEEYEVRDVGRREEAPNLVVSMELANKFKSLEFDKKGIGFSKPVGITLIIENESAAPADYSSIKVFVDYRLQVRSHQGFQQKNEVKLTVDNVLYPTIRLVMNHGIPGKLPLWKGPKFQLSDSPMDICFPADYERIKYLVGYSVSAPRMEEKSDFRFLEVKQEGLVVEPIDFGRITFI